MMAGVNGEANGNNPARLRVAIIHSFYSSRQPSGENAVVEQQAAALEAAGHDVALVAQQTDERERVPGYPIQAALTVASGRGPDPLRALRRFQPDVVHVHNLFPNYGRTWVSRWPGAIVATLHNFRPLCAAGTFFRDGHVCTDCLTARNSLPAIRHACYRGSRMRTLPLAASQRFGNDPVLSRAERIVVLSPTMADLYVNAGVEPSRVTVVPNFLRDAGSAGDGGGPWLFVGRLVPEKGIRDLLTEWPRETPLLVIGDGPLRRELEACASGGIQLLGAQSPERVRDLLKQARGLVFPSKWFEGFPMVYLEALAAGTPVLAWEPSSVADMVKRQKTGMVVQNLSTALKEAEDVFPMLRQRCRSVFENGFTSTAWTDKIAQVYAEAISERPLRATL